MHNFRPKSRLHNCKIKVIASFELFLKWKRPGSGSNLWFELLVRKARQMSCRCRAQITPRVWQESSHSCGDPAASCSMDSDGELEEVVEGKRRLPFVLLISLPTMTIRLCPLFLCFEIVTSVVRKSPWVSLSVGPRANVSAPGTLFQKASRFTDEWGRPGWDQWPAAGKI